MSTVATAGQRGSDWLNAIARAFLQWLDAWQSVADARGQLSLAVAGRAALKLGKVNALG